MTLMPDIAVTAAPPRQPRARGTARLAVKRRGGRSVVGDLYQAGSMKLLFPRGAGPDLTAVLLNTAGGVTGGDRFEFTAETGANGALTLTTQAAERAYRAAPDQTGRLRTMLRAGRGGVLHWLPQETLLYDGAALDRRLRIEMAADARVLMVEPLVLGRAAMGERVESLRFRDRIDLWRDGALMLSDRTRLDAALAGPATLGGHGALATLVYAAPDAEAHLTALRDALPATGGASLLRPGVILARLLAPDSFELRRDLIPILARLAGRALPRPWML